MDNRGWYKLLQVIGIILMSLTALFTLMGGVGTACVALDPTGFGSKFAGIAPFQWLWILFVLVGIAAGVMGIRAIILLSKGARNAYRASLVALIIGIVINAIHLLASRALRGSSMPVDGVLYTNIITLVIFLLLRIPGIWQHVNFNMSKGGKKTGRHGAASSLILAGFMSEGIQYLMAPTHTINGYNFADVWHPTLAALGLAMILAGFTLELFGTRILTGEKMESKNFVQEEPFQKR